MTLNETLFTAFQRRGVIQEKETEIRANFRISNAFGEIRDSQDDFTIYEIQRSPEFKLILSRNTNGAKITARVQDIKKIDGMEIASLAEAFDLNLDGTPSVYRFVEETNVKKEIVGKKEFTLPDGSSLQDGMRIVLNNDKTESLNEIPLTVRGVGTSIELKKPRGRPKKEV